MTAMKRLSPVVFPSRPARTVVRDHWEVTLAFENEGPGPWLADLSHKPRWDLQDNRVDDLKPAGCGVPPEPGACRLEGAILVSRMNRTQAAVWHLGTPAAALPSESGYTDVSEATVFLALFGPRVFTIAEKLSALDFMHPDRSPPFLLQGPWAHVPCQLVTLARENDLSGGILIACARGYAADLQRAIETAGAAHGLGPAGEDRFMSWMATLEIGRGF
jgi:hypothetical protein